MSLREETTFDKRLLIDQTIERLEQELQALQVAAREAHAAATHEESRAEDSHDTRGLEASYLARAQAARVTELENLLSIYRALPLRVFAPDEAIGLGAVVEVSDGRKSSYYYLIAQGGGVTVDFAPGQKVLVITSQAPMGEALLGSRAGDEIEVEAQGMTRSYEILTVW